MSEEKPRIPLHRERLNLPDNKEVLELNEKKRKQLRGDMAEVFNTPAGRRVLRHIMTITGWKKGVIGGNPAVGMDVLNGTLYNAARLQIMVELNEFISADILKSCEFGVVEDFIE